MKQRSQMHDRAVRTESRTRIFSRAIWVLCAATGLVWISVAAAQDFRGDASKAWLDGDYKKAAEISADYIKRTNDTKSPFGMEFTFYVAFYEYSQGNYEKAMPTFKELSEVKDFADLREWGVFYLADCNQRFGDSLAKEKDEAKQAVRKDAYAVAELGFNQYLNEFKEGGLAAYAGIGLAKTYAGQGRFEDSLRRLDGLIERVAKKANPEPYEITALVQAYNFKLAVAKSYREWLIAQHKKDEAEKFFAELKQGLNDFITKQKDPAVVNQLAGALGDLLFSLGDYPRAIVFYRATRPKEKMLEDKKRYANQVLADYQKALWAVAGNAFNNLRAKSLKAQELDRTIQLADAEIQRTITPKIREAINRKAEAVKKRAEAVKAKADAERRRNQEGVQKAQADIEAADAVIAAAERDIPRPTIWHTRKEEAEKERAGLMKEIPVLEREVANLQMPVHTAFRPKIQTANQEVKDIESKPDPLLTAYQQISLSYLAMKRFFEVNVIVRRLLPFVEGDQRKNMMKQAINSFINSRLTDETAQMLADYEKEFPGVDPELDGIAYYIGVLYEIGGQPKRALEFYEKSLRDYPTGKESKPSILRAGIVMFRENRFQEALDKFDAYHKVIGPWTEEYLYYRGKTLLALEQLDQAIEMLRELSKRHPAFPLRDDAVYSLADALLRQNQFMEAAEEIQKYLDDPEAPASTYRPALLYRLGAIYQGLGKPDDAVKAYKQLAEIPGTPLAFYAQLEIIKTLRGKDRDEPLRKLLEAQGAPAEVLAEARFLAGWRHQEDRQWDKAIAEYRIVVEKFPADKKAPEAQLNAAACIYAPVADTRNPGALAGAARVEWDATVRKAVEAYEKLIEMFPQSPFVERALTFLSQINAVKIHEQIATQAEVEDAFRKLARRVDKDPSLHARVIFALGNAHYLLRQPGGSTGEGRAAAEAQAMKFFDEAFGLNRNIVKTVDAYVRYGELMIKNNQLDRAEELFEQMSKHKFDDPNDQVKASVEASWWLGHVSFLKKNWDKAAEHFKHLEGKRWASRYHDAQFGLAFIAEMRAATPKALEEALNQYIDVEKGAGPVAIRAKAKLRIAYVYKKQAEAAPPPRDASLAKKTFVQMVLLYERERDLCAEAMYQVGQIYESEQNKPKAVESYQQAIAQSAENEYAEKARARLQELGVPVTQKQP